MTAPLSPEVTRLSPAVSETWETLRRRGLNHWDYQEIGGI